LLNDKIISVKIHMDHLSEVSKVGAINMAAFVISMSDVEGILRVGGLFLAFIYTLMKIIQLIKHWNN
jgi:hypothetical protein